VRGKQSARRRPEGWNFDGELLQGEVADPHATLRVSVQLIPQTAVVPFKMRLLLPLARLIVLAAHLDFSTLDFCLAFLDFRFPA